MVQVPRSSVAYCSAYVTTFLGALRFNVLAHHSIGTCTYCVVNGGTFHSRAMVMVQCQNVQYLMVQCVSASLLTFRLSSQLWFGAELVCASAVLIAEFSGSTRCECGVDEAFERFFPCLRVDPIWVE